MALARLFRHMVASHWGTRRLFPSDTLDAIERTIAASEKAHAGEIRFAIETSLPLLTVWDEVAPRTHALGVFAHIGVWDTEHNNGVLIYLQLADRSVEIIADRGLRSRVSAAEWEAACRLMEDHFRAGRFREGSIAGVEVVASLIARHFPAAAGQRKNELPDRPILL